MDNDTIETVIDEVATECSPETDGIDIAFVVQRYEESKGAKREIEAQMSRDKEYISKYMEERAMSELNTGTHSVKKSVTVTKRVWGSKQFSEDERYGAKWVSNHQNTSESVRLHVSDNRPKISEVETVAPDPETSPHWVVNAFRATQEEE